MRCAAPSLLLVLAASQAQAQRGLPQSDRYADTPLSGFPGFFDTFAPQKGDLVVNAGLMALTVPSVPIDYGITHNLSVGTNGVAGLGFLAGIPAGMLKVRLTSSPTDWLSVATTGYGLYAKGTLSSSEGSSSSKVTATGYMATFNSSLFFTRNTWLTATMAYASYDMEEGEPSESRYSKLNASLLLAAATFEHFFTRWFGLRGTAGVPLALSLANDGGTDATAIGIEISSQNSSLSFASVGADFRPGQQWLLAPTITTLIGDATLMPILSFEGSFRW